MADRKLLVALLVPSLAVSCTPEPPENGDHWGYDVSAPKDSVAEEHDPPVDGSTADLPEPQDAPADADVPGRPDAIQDVGPDQEPVETPTPIEHIPGVSSLDDHRYPSIPDGSSARAEYQLRAGRLSRIPVSKWWRKTITINGAHRLRLGQQLGMLPALPRRGSFGERLVVWVQRVAAWFQRRSTRP